MTGRAERASDHASDRAFDHAFDHDVVVVGSGFGGSVAALRLAEKGYDVMVLEAGRRFADADFARTSWDLRRFLWAPRLGLRGVQRLHLLPDVLVLAGAGVGGGSLNYANVHYVPPAEFFTDPQWAHITDWADELAPYYALASRMLGTAPVPGPTPADEVLRQVAEQMGRADTFRLTDVGVYFGAGRQGAAPSSDLPEAADPDPFFGGAGPARRPCVGCGNCMVGCRHGAKNTLVKNYLHLAESLGVRVQPDSTVVGLRRLPGGGFAVRVRRSGAWTGRGERTIRAEQVVLAAGTWGTQQLLHRMKATGALPELSDRLGERTRTNSEALVGASTPRVRPELRLAEGVAITSSFHPDEHTHVENVRYGPGSNAMGLLSTLLVDGDGRRPRWMRFLAQAAAEPRAAARSLSVRRWSERTVIGLVMQSVDNSLTVFGRRGRLGGWRLSSRRGHGEPSPRWIPVGHEVVRRVAALIGGEPGASIGDVLDVPMTAHFIGGVCIGSDVASGVLDGYHRAFGVPGLHVVDGSAVSANLGVNPSLTITAQAERALAMWPRRGDPDPRPALGEPYRRVPAVPASRPALDYAAVGIDLPMTDLRRTAGPQS